MEALPPLKGRRDRWTDSLGWLESLCSVEKLWLRRLSEFIAPTPAELEALENAKQGRRQFRYNEVIAPWGEPVQEVYFVVDGWVGSVLKANCGRRQLTKIYLPGDFAGLPNIAMRHGAENLEALTKVTVDVISLDRLAGLFETAPRFGCMLFVAAQQERVMLMDQLTAVGQLKAIQRVAALLIHLYRRLSFLRPGAAQVINWPLTQQRVAEATGLTSVHVNRTFRELTRRGLIAREGKQISLLDFGQLSELAGLPERIPVSEPTWLASCCVPRS